MERPHHYARLLRRSALGLAVVTSLAALAVPAAAKPAGAVFMTVGFDVPAPEGFADFCRRYAAHCAPTQTAAAPEAGLETVSDADGPRLPGAAGALSWPGKGQAAARRLTLEALSHEPQALSLSDGQEASTPRPAPRSIDVQAAADGALRALSPVAEASPNDEVAPGAQTAETTPAALPEAKAVWVMLETINRRINRAVRSRPDAAAYGREEFWTLPLNDGVRFGDCEDYALQKRAALIEAGYPAEALSVAVARLPNGDVHAVLLAATDKGEAVLDNLSPWVSRWDQLRYRWMMRQRPGRPGQWAVVGSSLDLSAWL